MYLCEDRLQILDRHLRRGFLKKLTLKMIYCLFNVNKMAWYGYLFMVINYVLLTTEARNGLVYLTGWACFFPWNSYISHVQVIAEVSCLTVLCNFQVTQLLLDENAFKWLVMSHLTLLPLKVLRHYQACVPVLFLLWGIVYL